MRKVLFVCNDTVGTKMAGPAIRCMELANALREEFDVTVAATSLDADYVPPVRLIEATPQAVGKGADQADVVIVQGDALRRFPILMKTKAAVVADLYCPTPLEFHMSSTRLPDTVRLDHGWHVARVMQEQLFFADYFLCASERQLDFWTGALTMAGRINALSMPDGIHTSLDHFITCVPFGLQDTSPTPNGTPLRDRFKIPRNEFLMVWGGGIYEWFDPNTIIEAVARLDQEGLRTHLVFMGVKHPNPGIEEHDRVGAAIALARKLGVLDRLVHFNFGWVDYASRHEHLLDADAGVSAHLNNAETRYSFRTRMLDYLWCGLPILATRGDEFGEMIHSKKLGMALGYENVDEWCHAIRSMATDPSLREASRDAVRRARSDFQWKHVTQPLADICRHLSPSADRKYARQRAREIGLGPHMGSPTIYSRVRAAYARNGLGGLYRAVGRRVLGRVGLMRRD